jgi:cysteinyl-tRNA synthetase
MTVFIFNTLTRSKAPFTPMEPGKVKMYVCGPTVYDAPHLGHARSTVIFDVIRRYLESRGYRVTLVCNVTDIDDTILQKARLQDQDFRTLGAGYLRRYEQAMERIGVGAPDARPKATEFMLPIQDFTARLLQKGHAYAIGGNVYFSVASFSRYGRLSGRTVQPAALDGTASDDKGKRHPADFALWKAAKPLEPYWDSPWGPGRPGWHIECSAMSAHLLGEAYDIHGGGEDLIFPHHENEIAQSESLFKKTPASYWMHHGMVRAGGRKISKSNRHFQKLDDLLEVYPADALRLFLISKRYRHPLAFDHQRMQSIVKNMTRIHAFFSRFGGQGFESSGRGKDHGTLWKRFCKAMDDDFNFPMALSIVFEGIRTVQRNLGAGMVAQGGQVPKHQQTAIFDLCAICRNVLGFDLVRDAAVTTQQPCIRASAK